MVERISVVVADDSPFVCKLLEAYLHSCPEIEVVGVAHDGLQALSLVKELRPSVATLDLDMPGVDGLTALDRIMHECPTPVVVVSGLGRRAAGMIQEALDRGAVDFVLKYDPADPAPPEALRHEVIAKLRTAARVRVVRSLRSDSPAKVMVHAELARHHERYEYPAEPLAGVVVVGASTGGPVALRALLSALPEDFPAAVLIVQHMPDRFTSVLAAHLQGCTGRRIREARAGDRLEAGTILVAPGGSHLLLTSVSTIELSEAPPVNGHRPSIDVAMQSVAQFYGVRTHGILLTGMGSDGAQGLVAIKAKGGRTFAQDSESCAIDGMPTSAVQAGAVDTVAPPEAIARLLTGGP